MTFPIESAVVLWFSAVIRGQAAKTGTTHMKFITRSPLRFILPTTLLLTRFAPAQVADAPDGTNSGIRVNYTEAKVGTYTLPDPLTLIDGQPVRNARTWLNKRRPEIVHLYEENQFGRAPKRPKDLSFDVFEKGTPAMGGTAIRRQVTIHFTKDSAGPTMDLLIYLPTNSVGKKVPLLLNASFSANNLAVDDPGVKVGRTWDRRRHERVPAKSGPSFGRAPVERVLADGIGFATVNYQDIDPDAPGAIAQGVRAAYLRPGQTDPAPDEWGTIAAWAWGLSCALDYLETDPGVDAKRVCLMGVSRLGKTVLWTGASDPRFAAVIASCSGEGGASLSRRNYGETIELLTITNRYPYQFCANYATWAHRVNEFPVDAHMLVSLIAPRPLLLQTGDTDHWSDPKGEFLAAVAATPVYRLLGQTGIDTDTMPSAGHLVGGTLSYYMHSGGHGTVPSDWDVFLKFMDAHLKQRSR